MADPMSIDLGVDDVEHQLDGARVLLRVGADTATMHLGAIGDAAVEAAVAAARAALDAGATLEQAARAGEQVGEIPHRCQRLTAPDGVLVIDDTLAETTEEVRRSLKVLADATRSVTRSFAVIGELRTSPADWFDDHDGLGRLAVRLDIDQLIVVGHGARHASTAAGLEGSWDGESILVDDVPGAYDELRARLRPGDAVLVSAAALTPLNALITRLTEEPA
jgi:UDP-N-acetylmuramyl pentapeptide synthase